MMDALAVIARVFCLFRPWPSEGEASLLTDRPRDEDLAPFLTVGMIKQSRISCTLLKLPLGCWDHITNLVSVEA